MSFCVYSSWGVIELLDLWIYSFYQIQKNFNYYVF